MLSGYKFRLWKQFTSIKKQHITQKNISDCLDNIYLMTTAQIRRAKSIKCFKIQVMHVQGKNPQLLDKKRCEWNEICRRSSHLTVYPEMYLRAHTNSSKKYIVHSEFAIWLVENFFPFLVVLIFPYYFHSNGAVRSNASSL